MTPEAPACRCSIDPPATSMSVRVARVSGSGYTIRTLEEVPDAFGGQYPGSMRFLTEQIGAEQIAFTHRVMPAKSGGKGSYGHRHKTQEEIYFVISGKLQFKLDDDLVDVGGGSAVRVAPHTVRSIWNDGPDDAELVICSVRLDNPRADGEIVQDFWPG
jgi:mannose-6-phosphate isomerase-like protein (cupin superfamily)